MSAKDETPEEVAMHLSSHYETYSTDYYRQPGWIAISAVRKDFRAELRNKDERRLTDIINAIFDRGYKLGLEDGVSSVAYVADSELHKMANEKEKKYVAWLVGNWYNVDLIE